MLAQIDLRHYAQQDLSDLRADRMSQNVNRNHGGPIAGFCLCFGNLAGLQAAAGDQDQRRASSQECKCYKHVAFRLR